MENGVARYYDIHDTTRKDTRGYNGVYAIMDRTTLTEVATCDNYSQAKDKMAELEKADKIARGIKVINMIEIPYTHRDRARTVTELIPVTIHK